MDLQKLSENAGLDLYKKLLLTVSDFCDTYPGTGVGKIYNQVLAGGIKIMPKDKKALEIIKHVVSNSSGPRAMQDLLNKTFLDLPLNLRPLYKDKNSKVVAFWLKGDQLCSKVIDLLNLEDQGGGKWSDEQRKSVDLINFNEEE
jgi:hypothetical protein